ncbi:hypothetical protein MXB_2807, partial [Myxobolus squamalis]
EIYEQNSFVEKIIELYGESPENFYKIIECLKDVKLGFNEIYNKLIILKISSLLNKNSWNSVKILYIIIGIGFEDSQ